MRKISHITLLFVLLVGLFPKHVQGSTTIADDPCLNQKYLDLLEQFPEESQALGIEPSFPGPPMNQPMTMATILSSEVLRFRACPNDESGRRIRLAVDWLLDNSDADEDGIPGWGLPHAWDAFGDGTINPINSPYTITTALVNESLLDALSISSFWTNIERENIRSVLYQVAMYWSQSAWTDEGASGAFFWYSPDVNDAYFVINVSAMMVGNLARFLDEHEDVFSSSDEEFIQERIDKSAQAIVSQVSMRDGLPFWLYGTDPPKMLQPNDLIHHIFILWGMELYRLHGGKIPLTWSLQQAVTSVSSFRKNGIIYGYPQDVIYDNQAFEQPAILWSVGMLVAFEARWGSTKKAIEDLDIVEIYYGPSPLYRLYPPSVSNDENFYPRFAAFVLLGSAYANFHQQVYKYFLPKAYSSLLLNGTCMIRLDHRADKIVQHRL